MRYGFRSAVSLTAAICLAGACIAAPHRIVVDPHNPGAVSVFRGNHAPRSTQDNGTLITENPGVQVPWETKVVLRTASGQDSFLVASSRKGCPGTEVKPSVSVAFATSRGWSSNPIRFGPLAWKTTCALGRGMELEVRAIGRDAPFVKLIERDVTIGQR